VTHDTEPKPPEEPMHPSVHRSALLAAKAQAHLIAQAAVLRPCECHAETLLEAQTQAIREDYQRKAKKRAEEEEMGRALDLHRLLLRAGVPPVLADRLRRGNLEKRPSLLAARLWWGQQERPPFLAMFGPSDAGKSFAAAWALARWCKDYPWNHGAGGGRTAAPALFIRAAELSERVFDEEELRHVARAHFLVLDEVGAEFLTGPMEKVLRDLITERHAFRRLTVFTSNMDFAWFELRMDGRKDGQPVGPMGRRLRDSGFILNGRTLRHGDAVLATYEAAL
jgi:DNA replication protein DnaC